MSDGSNDFELFKGPAAKEKDEKSDEKFRDEMRQAQQALAQLQKEEGQAKAHDFGLAAIIVQFLSQPQFTDLFLLVSRVVALNISSDFVIAILALIDPKSEQETKRLLTASHHKASPQGHAALVLRHEAGFHTLSPEQKRALEHWFADLTTVAHHTPEILLETMLVPGAERKVAPVLVQLTAFIVRYFLESHHVSIDFQHIRDFAEGMLAEIAKGLAHELNTRKHLKAA